MPKKTTSPQATTEKKCCGCCCRFNRAKAAFILMLTAFAVEFISTHTPAARLPKIYYSDKTLHLIAYAMLGAVFIVGLLMRGWRLRNIVLAGVIFFPLYGAFDEITQPLVNRTADYRDWRMDMFGSIGAILLIAIFVIVWKKIRKSKLNTQQDTSGA